MKKALHIFLMLILLFQTLTPGISAQDLENTATSEAKPSPDLVQDLDYTQYSATDAAINSLTVSPQPGSASFRQQTIIRRLRKSDFRASEKVSIVVENAYASNLEVKVFYASGEEVPVEISEVSDTSPAILNLSLSSSAKPGRYRIKITDSVSGEVSTQNFTWGVLAINPNKSIYLPNEEAKLSLAVLDEVGMMVCDANVSLEIVDPIGGKKILSTQEGQIKVNNECNTKDFVSVPDYEASYLTGDSGVYKLNLSAVTKNGSHSITDLFEVRESVEFDIERNSATRIYPPVDYQMKAIIKASQDFDGTISEIVPTDFDIKQLAGSVPFESVDTKHLNSTQKSVLGAQVFNLALPYKEDHPVSQGFGALENDPLLKKKYQDNGVIGHDGVDFDLPKGSDVLAADGGKVVRARENYDYGTTIVIQHSWGKSYYGHLSELGVEEGQRVKKGERIGLSGNTGISTDPHLHFGIKPNTNDSDNGYFGKINPLPSLGMSQKSDAYPESVSRNVLGASIENTYKVITWKVKVKKGEEFTLGYSYKAPQVSPQFYLLGPLEFVEDGKVVFKEVRQWQIAADVVTNNGRLYYGDVTNTGVLKFQTHTNDFTFNGEVSTGVATVASPIYYLVAKPSPTRDETTIAHIKATGRLDVIRCTGGCDAAGDFDTTNDWNAVVNNAMTCSGTTPVDCTRPFDAAYEALSGRVMVVYAGDTADGDVVPDNQKLYYCYWDGSAWGPVSTCAPTDGSNDITLTSNGRPTYVTLKRQSGSNKILMGVSIDVAGTHEAEAFIWSGSAWGNSVVATDTTNLTATIEKGNSIDVDWEQNNGDAIIIYGTTAAVEIKYKIFTGGSWGSEQDAINTNLNGASVMGLNADRDPNSDRIIVATNDTSNDIAVGVWKADGSTSGWTSLTASVNEVSIENQTTGPPYTDVIWEPIGSEAIIFAQNAGNNVDVEYSRVSCTGSGCTATAIDASVVETATQDDGLFVRLAQSPNSDEIMALYSGIDGTLMAQHWNGTAWEAADSGILEADLSGPAATTNTIFQNLPATFTYIPYTAWARNWRWTDDLTTNDPTTWLALEDVAPADVDPNGSVVRLRYNFAELSGMSETNTRKKLQFVDSVTCASPDSCATANWTDVGAQGSAVDWRYADCDSADGTQQDDDAIGASRLTGTTQNGTFVKNGTAASVSDHNALATIEYDYCLEANGTLGSVTYYFRAQDLEQGVILRDQRSGSGANTCGSSSNQACTYPSIAMGASGPTLTQIIRHGGWFLNGVEQPFTF